MGRQRESGLLLRRSVTFSYGGILAVGLTPEAGQDDAFIKRGERWAVVDALQRSVPLMSTADDPDREEELRLQVSVLWGRCA